ncbi:uncharacterized protein [Branchiostoma lanceolatum]|uniref:uncharacterized protein n=1 Tax=Branchiostoma lanceolatum TaxID=7740 RepID=UPI0034516291
MGGLSPTRTSLALLWGLCCCLSGAFATTGLWLARQSSWVVDSSGTPWVNNGVTYDAAKALDGNTGTYWNPQSDQNFNNWYIVLDFAWSQTLTRIAVTNYGDTVHDVAAFTLQKSQIGSPYDWEDVVSVTNVQGGTDQRQEFGRFQETARYWRFLITRTHTGWQPWLTELNLYGFSSVINAALDKTAFQTSTLHGTEGVAGLAVDGFTNTHVYGGIGSCTHTQEEANPSWWVDLGQSYMIGRVVIFNRQDCCSERINPFNIHIGDSDQVNENPKCGGDHEIDVNQPSVSIPCPEMEGRYVGVRLAGPSRVLTLCEVQLFTDCQGGDGASYRGTVSVTKFGLTCQRWDSQAPHEHDKTPASYPSSGLEENYCRNPDGEPGVWCFTTSIMRWAFCDVPVCVEVNQVICPNGTIMDETRVCDGRDDCGDNTDELQYCCEKQHTISCSNGNCILPRQVCDRNSDCEDGSDELYCPLSTCDNGALFYPATRCDGRDDCGDNSDEENCGRSPERHTRICNLTIDQSRSQALR